MTYKKHIFANIVSIVLLAAYLGQPPAAQAQTASIPISSLSPAPTSGTLSNGVGFSVNVGSAHSQQGYVAYPPESPQIWTFDQPVSLRFGLRGLNVPNNGGECFELPAGAVDEFINPAHSWDPVTRRLCRINSTDVSESIFTLDGPVTELELGIVSGAAGAGRGPGFIEVTLPPPDPVAPASVPVLPPTLVALLSLLISMAGWWTLRRDA